MQNVDDSIFRTTLEKTILEFGITVMDVENMDFSEFKELCAQLGEKELNQLNSKIKNDKWKAHIWSVLDRAAFVKNKR